MGLNHHENGYHSHSCMILQARKSGDETTPFLLPLCLAKHLSISFYHLASRSQTQNQPQCGSLSVLHISLCVMLKVTYTPGEVWRGDYLPLYRFHSTVYPLCLQNSVCLSRVMVVLPSLPCSPIPAPTFPPTPSSLPSPLTPHTPSTSSSLRAVSCCC